MKPSNHPIMTVREVAEILKVAEKTVYAMAIDGELPAFRVRSQWRIRRVDLDAWMAQQLGRNARSTAQAEQPVSTGRTEVEEPDEPVTARQSTSRDADSTERLPQAELHQRLLSALGSAVLHVHTAIEAKPFEIDLAPPLPHRVRIYMYNATRPPGGRPLGEHKIQLIVPGKGRGERASFDHGDGRIVLLIGYAAEEDVFILWDAGLYSDFAWSRNVQVKAETIIEASAGKLATQERQLRPATGKPTVETVIAAKSRRLGEAIVRRMELTRQRMLRD